MFWKFNKAQAVRQGDWKLVWSKRMPHKIKWELYNLAEDIGETQNLYAAEPEIVEALTRELERIRDNEHRREL
mgnify:CR=1 FL=1